MGARQSELWLLHCRFFGLSFEIFVFLQLSFSIAHIVLEDWVDPCFFLVSSGESSLWGSLAGAAQCDHSPLEGDVTWSSAHKSQFGVKLS